MNKIIFNPPAIDEMKAFAQNNPKLVKKIFELITDIQKHPFDGLGKPEALKHSYKGYWSRRITDEHRLIYEVLPGNDIYILSVHGHYEL